MKRKQKTGSLKKPRPGKGTSTRKKPAERLPASEEILKPENKAKAGENVSAEQIWDEYSRTHSLDLRDKLIEMYVPLVRQEAERMSAKLPPMVDVNDLIGAGTLGLIDAISKFDHTRGIKFETYCGQRLRGSMLDDLRRYDWVPRLIRNKIHQLDRSRDELETKIKRPATEEELADHLELSMDDLDRLKNEINVKTMVSLDRKWDEDGENEMSHLDTLTDKRIKNPLDKMHRDEIKNLAMRGLSENEKAILVMYYYDDMSLKEIGSVLNISESRVCQIHQQTLSLLRDKFNAREVSTL
ncbi:MAG: FliA/WhiG family RNA polymerase sigma factor [Planctomycetes bacterium]|nr:FliA/WhiG family RNA polymerase sigma factor [Planctomycetota bacterium]